MAGTKVHLSASQLSRYKGMRWQHYQQLHFRLIMFYFTGMEDCIYKEAAPRPQGATVWDLIIDESVVYGLLSLCR